jgi:hypothetical protein
MEEYQQACKLKKKYLALEVVVLVGKYGDWFLKRNPDGWWEKVSNKEAREKVSMTFCMSMSSGYRGIICAKGPHRYAGLENQKWLRIGQEEVASCFLLPFFRENWWASWTEPKPKLKLGKNTRMTYMGTYSSGSRACLQGCPRSTEVCCFFSRSPQ